MGPMEQFNFNRPAELFVAPGRGAVRRKMSYRRFASGAEAIKYAIEVVGPDNLWGTIIETDEARLGADEIRLLYQRPDYPLPRSGAS